MAEEVIAESERLFEAAEAQKLLDLMIQHKDSKNDELLWRLARACREVAMLNSTAADCKKELIYEAHEYAKQAVEINPNNGFAHKWTGITLSGIGDYEGNKKKIEDAYKIKAEFEKAIELNANDGTSMHLLGQWCYTIADMSWYVRKIASVAFGTPPESSFEEARKWFQACEDSPQASFSRNHLWLGMTCHKLNDKENAIKWLTQCRDHNPTKDEEVKHQEEAKALLAKLGVK